MSMLDNDYNRKGHPMKNALVLILGLSACATQQGAPLDESSAEQAVVIESNTGTAPSNLDELAACLDLPDNLTLDWIKQHLVYTDSCFHSWTVDIDVVDCPIGNQLVDGTVRVAGGNMASIPRTGVLVRTKAAAAALLDLAALYDGSIKPRVDLEVAATGVTATACTSVRPFGWHTNAGLSLTHPVLGAFDLEGGLDLTKADGLPGSVDFSLAVSAVPTDGPAIEGQLVGTGISRDDHDLCPDAGEVRFDGSIDGVASEILLSYVGDDQVLITLPDGSLVGPATPRFCSP